MIYAKHRSLWNIFVDQFKAHSQAVCIQPAERGGMVNNLSFRYINEVVSDVFKRDLTVSSNESGNMMVGVNSHAGSAHTGNDVVKEAGDYYLSALCPWLYGRE